MSCTFSFVCHADSCQLNAAVIPIRTAILRIDPSGATFTSSHLLLTNLCLQEHAFASALPVLDRDISFIPIIYQKKDEPPVNSLSPLPCSSHDSSSAYVTVASGISDRLKSEDYLIYFLHGALIYIALKDWERALFFLEVVISSPSSGPTSKIQVEAYKKWLLVGLLHKGRVSTNFIREVQGLCLTRMLQAPRAPKNISAQTARTYQALGKPYTNLAEVFKEGIKNEENESKLVAEAEYAHGVWQEDFNEGLIRQVISAYRQFSVQHLEQAYRALTVADVTRRTSPNPEDYAGTANYLLELIQKDLLEAEVSSGSSDEPATWVLRFNSFDGKNISAQSEDQQYDALKRQIEKVSSLTDDVREADRQLGLSKEYVHDARLKLKISKENALEDDRATQNPEFFIQDEDMMEDV